GWANPEGDAFYARQRKRADESAANLKTQQFFFGMMIAIGGQMFDATGILDSFVPKNRPLEVLDLCMAPGGFSAATLKKVPRAKISGISLPESLGGHKLLVQSGAQDRRVEVQFHDVTMLYKEFGVIDMVQSIPPSHPWISDFSGVQPYADRTFDLAFCDGQKLRTHTRPDWGQHGHEAIRLSSAQLVFALSRLKPGGILIMLLHRIDKWATTKLMYTFSKFTDPGGLQLFKPVKSHASRGSFYLVARGVRTDSPEAAEAIEAWKQTWLDATLAVCDKPGENSGDDNSGGKDDGETWTQGDDDECEDVRHVIDVFGERLVELGTPIWKIQANSLAKASYTQ
ncbi:hypothetical protein AJ80_08743, partial [Polytolypa hystricis UAMH7299]